MCTLLPSILFRGGGGGLQTDFLGINVYGSSRFLFLELVWVATGAARTVAGLIKLLLVVVVLE
jgi:hypothetical protein